MTPVVPEHHVHQKLFPVLQRHHRRHRPPHSVSVDVHSFAIQHSVGTTYRINQDVLAVVFRRVVHASAMLRHSLVQIVKPIRSLPVFNQQEARQRHLRAAVQRQDRVLIAIRPQLHQLHLRPAQQKHVRLANGNGMDRLGSCNGRIAGQAVLVRNRLTLVLQPVK